MAKKYRTGGGQVIAGNNYGSVPEKFLRKDREEHEKVVITKAVRNGGWVMDITRDMTLLSAPYDVEALRWVVEESDILNQCIEAYATNIAGFGIEPKYIEAETEETNEMKNEWDLIRSIVSELSIDRPTKEVIQEAIRHVEQTGNGYLEIIRNISGEVVGIDTLQPEFVTVSKENRIPMSDGSIMKVRYYRYADTTGDDKRSQIWFKTFGDPTPLNINGSISEVGEGTATEVVHIKNGDFHSAYGVPRWVGPLIKIIGSRKADELNYRYFLQGRHTPLAIILENAQLTNASEASLKEYANAVGGEENQHKFLIIEAEKADPDDELLDYSPDKSKPSVKLEHMADVLQNDALFLNYNENVQQAVLGAFRLPPIYVAKTTDYNRATADTAKELTEEQVFRPLRETYSWILNNILKGYKFAYAELVLKNPVVSNVSDLVSVVNVANQAGAVAPNDLRATLSQFLNIPLDNFEGDEYNLPRGASQSVQQQPDILDINKAYGVTADGEIASALRGIWRARNERPATD